MSGEAKAAQDIRLDAAACGVDLWRNNSGAFQDVSGRWVRYGLCNDSAELNEHVKSSDLIGIRPMIITPEWVGHRVGVFIAVETKLPGWRLTPGDKRGQAQARFHDIVRADGGFAGFASSVEEWRRIACLS